MDVGLVDAVDVGWGVNGIGTHGRMGGSNYVV